MAKIDELLKELCPDGVEWKELVDVVKTISPPIKLKVDSYLRSGLFPIIDQSKDQIAGYTDDISNTLPDGQYILYGDHTLAVKYYDGRFAQGADGLKILLSKGSLPKYIYYCICAYNIQSNEYKRHWTQAKQIKLPIPPLPIQHYIVEALDTFTDAIGNLEEELTLREKQLEYYRSEFVDNKLYSEVKLKDVASYSKLKINASEVNKDTYISVENLLQNKAGKIESSCCPTNGKCIKFLPKDILIGNIRPYLKKIWFSDCEGGTNGDVLDIRVKSDTLDPKYLFEILSSDNFFRYYTQHSAGGKMPRGDKNAVMNYSFCIPPIERQHEIVEILDTFEAMIANIKVEIALRTKQYEYYREKLLSFGK